jgi:hypothetical protein
MRPLARLGLAAVAVLLNFAGCATAPVTQLTHASAPARVAGLHTVVVAPLDAELSELTAGGIAERRDDWTEQAAKNLATALSEEAHWPAPPPPAPDRSQALRAETEDVQALLRAITLNHLSRHVPSPVAFPNPIPETLTYQTGSLEQHAAVGCDAALFVLVRDSYATAGRKALLVLGVLSAGVTGVALIPNMGADITSAALVDRDGTVLWFNYQLGGGDPRTLEGAREVAKKLLATLPRAKA